MGASYPTDTPKLDAMSMPMLCCVNIVQGITLALQKHCTSQNVSCRTSHLHSKILQNIPRSVSCRCSHVQIVSCHIHVCSTYTPTFETTRKINAPAVVKAYLRLAFFFFSLFQTTLWLACNNVILSGTLIKETG